MSLVGVKELKNRLTYYLRRTKQGEEVIVTERGRPIAVLHSIQAAEQATSLDARLARLASLGTVTLPTHKTSPRRKAIKIPGPPVSQAILEDRR